MAWPSLYVFVRHGESEGNVLSVDERAACDAPTHRYHLTPRGREQARITGEWLRQEFGAFDVHYASTYVRSRETLELMAPGARIYEDARLNEADRGVYHVMTQEEMHRHMPWELKRKERFGLYHYRPPGGESWNDIELRAHSWFGTLNRDCGGKKVLVCGHGHWKIISQRLLHHISIEEAERRYREATAPNASVTIYRGVEKDGQSRLELQTDDFVPWKDRIP